MNRISLWWPVQSPAPADAPPRRRRKCSFTPAERRTLRRLPRALRRCVAGRFRSGPGHFYAVGLVNGTVIQFRDCWPMAGDLVALMDGYVASPFRPLRRFSEVDVHLSRIEWAKAARPTGREGRE